MFLLLQGCFTVTSQMPVQYTVTEVHGIFDLHNKVGTASWPTKCKCGWVIVSQGRAFDKPCNPEFSCRHGRWLLGTWSAALQGGHSHCMWCVFGF